MASVDLRHAYYSVKIAEEQQKYLCFKWLGKIYQFTCLPNGISDGPQLFAKLMKPIFATLREKVYTITSSSWLGCKECIQSTIQVLSKMGFCINEEKSVLQPTKRIEYLGNIINSRNHDSYATRAQND